MNTETGRIYTPDEHAARLNAMDERRELDEHQAEFERAYGAGRVVPVSEQVASQQLAGQRVEERRRKRKAAKAARQRNRRA